MDGLVWSSGYRYKGLWAGGMWTDLWEWAPSVNVFVSHANAHWETSTTGKAVHNHIDNTTWSVDFSQPLLLSSSGVL